MPSTDREEPMRTQEEIIDKIEASNTFFGFDKEVYIYALDYEHAHPYLKPEVTKEEWESDLEQEGPIEKRMASYMEFAIGKALDHRGISANRSVEKLNAFSWLLGQDEWITEPYAQYGVPILKALAERHDLPWPDDERLNNMAEGRKCTPDCRAGCGL